MASLSFVSSVASGRCAIAIAVAGLFAATVTSRAETTIEPGVDRPGADLSSFDLPQADLALCRQACEEQAACKAYTYVKPGVQGPKARCWLKSSVPPAMANSCCTSGVKVLPVNSSGGSSGITNPGPTYRRTDEPSTARPGPGDSREGPAAKSGQSPGPLGRGTAVGSLNGKANPDNFPVCEVGGAGKAISEVLDLLETIFGEFGGTFDINAWCGRYKREISTGVTLAPAQVPPGVPAKWGLLGGRGKLMADATMCLLKDIGEKAERPPYEQSGVVLRRRAESRNRANRRLDQLLSRRAHGQALSKRPYPRPAHRLAGCAAPDVRRHRARKRACVAVGLQAPRLSDRRFLCGRTRCRMVANQIGRDLAAYPDRHALRHRDRPSRI